MAVDAQGRFRAGLKTTAWLHGVGLHRIQDVAALGVIETCALLRRAGHPVSLNLAYGLQGDLLGLPWNRLPEEVRDRIRDDYRARFG